MNVKFILFFLFIAVIQNVSCNLTLLKGLLNVFSSSKNDSMNAVDQDHIPTVTKLERSSLISEHDHKLVTGNPKDGLFGNNLILHLKEMLKRNSFQSPEMQARIVNIEDSDEGDNDLGKDDMDGIHMINSNNDLVKEHHLSGNDWKNIKDSEDEDDDEDDDDEDAFERNAFFDKKSTKEDVEKLEKEVNKTDLELPPKSKIIEQLKNSLSAELRQLANQSNANSTNSNQIDVANYNQTDAAISSNHTYIYIKDGNQTITSHANLGNDASSSNVLPAIMHSELLGNTLYSLEKILGRYKFLNLYPHPTINDTHNDRDLHQKNDEKVVLKANFADYSSYSNTEKSTILGPAPPVQNLTDISFGNIRVKNNLTTSDGQTIIKKD